MFFSVLQMDALHSKDFFMLMREDLVYSATATATNFPQYRIGRTINLYLVNRSLSYGMAYQDVSLTVMSWLNASGSAVP